MMKKHCSCCSHCCASFFKRISIVCTISGEIDTAQPSFQVVCELMRPNLGVRSSQVTLQATRSDKLATAQRTFLGSRLLVLPTGGQIMSWQYIPLRQLHLCRTREFLCLNPVPHSGQEKAFSVLCTFICT